MKKTFVFSAKNKHPDRVLEGIKYEIKKYLKRERGKKLPEGATYWEFDCHFGKDSKTTQRITQSQINTSLDDAQAQGWDECYIEILAKPITKDTGTKE